MQQVLLDHLRKITEEEQRILDGVAEVDKDLYTSGKDFTVDSAKMLSEGKLIAVRTHTHGLYIFRRTGTILSRCFMSARDDLSILLAGRKL